MELLQPTSSEISIATVELENPSDAYPIREVGKEAPSGSKRKHKGVPQQKVPTPSPMPSERITDSCEAQELGFPQLVVHHSPEGDRCPSALQRHLEKKVVNTGDPPLPSKDRKGLPGGLVAEHQSALLATRQPQVFNLSAKLSHGDPLTERAAENPDIYEVDWHDLEFKPVFHDDADLADGLSRSSPAVTPFVDKPVQKKAAHDPRESTHACRKFSLSCNLSDLQTSALPTTPSGRVYTHFSPAQTAPWSQASPTFATSLPTGCDAFYKNPRAGDSAATRRATSWARTCATKSATARSLFLGRSHRGQSVSPKTSASVSQPSSHLERGFSVHPNVVDASAALRCPPFPCQLWPFISARHTFSRLETLNCSGTSLKSETVHAFALLARLKHLRLANCDLQDLGFLSYFVNAVPLESLVVPFNRIATVSFTEYGQTVIPPGSDDGELEAAYFSVRYAPGTDVQQGRVPAVVSSEVSELGASWNKHPNAAGLTGGARHQPVATQRGRSRKTNSSGNAVERRLETAILAADQGEFCQEGVQREVLADGAAAERSVPEDRRDLLAEEVHEGKVGGEKLRRESTEAISRQEQPPRGPSSGVKRVFPNSLRVVDLSYNRLGDARELLPFCSKFEELQEIKVCGNFFPHVSTSLLQQIGYTLRSKGVSFVCEGVLTQKEDQLVLLGSLPSSSPRHCTLLAELPGEEQVVLCTPFCQDILNVPQVTKDGASSPATGSTADSTLHHLQQLVKRLAKEKATLAEELKQVQHLTAYGGRERPSANHKIRDGGAKLRATPLCCAGVTCMKFETTNEGDGINRWLRHTADNEEIKTARVDLSLCEGGGKTEDSARNTYAPLGLTRRRQRCRRRGTVSYDDVSRIDSSSVYSSDSAGRHTSDDHSAVAPGENQNRVTRESYSNGTDSNKRSDDRISLRSSCNIGRSSRRCRKQPPAAVQRFSSSHLLPPRQDPLVPFFTDELSWFRSFLYFAEGVKLGPAARDKGDTGVQEYCLNNVTSRPSSSPATICSTAANRRTIPVEKRPQTGRVTVAHDLSGYELLCPTESDGQISSSIFMGKRAPRCSGSSRQQSSLIWKRERSCPQHEASLSELFMRAGFCLADVERDTDTHNWARVAHVVKNVTEKVERVKACVLQLCSGIYVLEKRAAETGKKCLTHLQRLEKARKAFIRGLKQLVDTGMHPKFYTALLDRLTKLEAVRRAMRKKRQKEDKEPVAARILRVRACSHGT